MNTKLIKKEFVPYELSLRLKELGFDEPCLTWWHKKEFVYPYWEREFGYNYESGITKDCVLSPLFQQTFRWFREKYDLWQCIQKYPTSENPNRCYYELKGDNINADKDESPNSYMSGWFDSYEEAELSCLEKLIELVEQKEK